MASSTNKRSHWRCSLRKRVLRNFAKFTGKHLYHSLFLNKVTGLRPATLLKRDPGTGILQNTSRRLLLKKKGFLNQHLIKVSKLLVFVLLSFFIISNIMIKIFFSRITVLYLIAEVERKEKTFFFFKYEIILFQKEKRSKMFQVRAKSKDVYCSIIHIVR